MTSEIKSTELKTDEMIINMGPQHPATHGVLRLQVKTDGEVVSQITPYMGYLHRCFEKHCENVTYEGEIQSNIPSNHACSNITCRMSRVISR